MQPLFKVKVKSDATIKGDKEVALTEDYLIEAISFSDAENSIIEQVSPFASNILILDISRFKVNEVILNDTGDYYYKAKVEMIILDEHSGKEKRLPILFLINADTLDEAKDILNGELKKSMGDYSIAKIEETKIVSYFTNEKIHRETI